MTCSRCPSQNNSRIINYHPAQEKTTCKKRKQELVFCLY